MMKRSKTHRSIKKTNGIKKRHARGPMTIFDSRTSKKDDQKTIIIINDHNSMSTIKKIITKSNSRQIKSKQKNLTFTSREKVFDRFSMRLANRSPNKKENIAKGAKLKNRFLFLKRINVTVIIVIRYFLNSLNFSFISLQEAIEKNQNPIFNCAKIWSQWDLRLLW